MLHALIPLLTDGQQYFFAVAFVFPFAIMLIVWGLSKWVIRA